METNGDIAHKYWFTNTQVVSIIIAVIVATFTISGIFFEFSAHSFKIDKLEKDLKYERERTDRKYDRLQKRVEELETVGSDTPEEK